MLENTEKTFTEEEEKFAHLLKGCTYPAASEIWFNLLNNK
jgi:hypothetical protein